MLASLKKLNKNLSKFKEFVTSHEFLTIFCIILHLKRSIIFRTSKFRIWYSKKDFPMALTRADIAERLIAKSNLPKNLAQDFVDAFFEDIASTLEKGEVVKLTGFGNFELKQKKARPGRNPKTGKEVIISERRVTTFRAGQKLRNRIDNEN